MSSVNLYGSSSWYSQNNDYTSNVRQKKETNILSQMGFTGSSDTSSVDPLESLVTAGTITEDQETDIRSAIETAIQSSAYSRYQIQSGTTTSVDDDPLASLVEAGTITEDQKSAVLSALQSEMKPNGAPPPPPPEDDEEDYFDTTLESLVSAGTITEDQKTSIIEALQTAFESAQTQSSTTSDNTSTDPLVSLVSAGTITEEQKAAIESALQSEMKPNGAPPPPPPEDDEEDSFDTTLESLVSAGTITEDQKTSIIEALQTAFESAQAQSSTTSDSSNNSTTSEAYYKGLSQLISEFQTALQAYETQFEAGQDDKVTNTMEVSF